MVFSKKKRVHVHATRHKQITARFPDDDRSEPISRSLFSQSPSARQAGSTDHQKQPSLTFKEMTDLMVPQNKTNSSPLNKVKGTLLEKNDDVAELGEKNKKKRGGKEEKEEIGEKKEKGDKGDKGEKGEKRRRILKKVVGKRDKNKNGKEYNVLKDDSDDAVEKAGKESQS